MPRGEGKRVLVFHKNVPSMVSQITNEFSKLSMNIENMINKSNKEIACTMIDVIGEVKSEMVEDFMKIEGVVRVRVID
jgi:D-3-phosphoglycerate dehydrogenase